MSAAPFSSDLVENARRHKWFLQKLHSLGVSVHRSSDESLRRYQCLWLPLVDQNKDADLFPPPDIAWLWHCHRLAPNDYAGYTKKTFGTLLEANPPFCMQFHDSHGARADETRALWTKLYPSESFFLTETTGTSTFGTFQVSPLLGFDLLESTVRQGAFLWQVSDDHFEDEEFLKEGVENYLKFLKLKPNATASGIVLVPTYQIDLMWHTHMLASISHYNKDCRAVMGATLHHDDSLTDRSDGGVLDVSFSATKNLWKDAYGVDYAVIGGMYRGEPPAQYYSTEWHPTEKWQEPGGHRKLVGTMGASSTSPPTAWAKVNGTTSDGSPGFIPQTITARSQLKTMQKRDNYILGRPTQGAETGYYHIETKEATTMLANRVARRKRSLESEIAMDKCCCGLESKISEKEKELADISVASTVLNERKSAAKPFNSKYASKHSDYYGAGGYWLYPDIMYDCAGGACGGAIFDSGGGNAAGACGAGACGASGCGGGGGGCGGGGCGGGGGG